MAVWKIPVTFEMCGTVEVEASTLEDAMEIARDEANDIPLPDEKYYVDGSWQLSTEDEDIIRQCYNKNQADEKTKYHVSNIVWSLDDEEECSEEGKPSLPTEIDVDVVISEGSEENDAICDLLSDTYGFCVESFSFEKIEE